MAIEIQSLEKSVKDSGGAAQPAEDMGGLLGKLNHLDGTGRYGQLLQSIRASNDKNNFQASVLEATFAHQFERAGFQLDYEVKQLAESNTSIDFKLADAALGSVFFELRLLQQDQATTSNIEGQLQATGWYRLVKDAGDLRKEIVRLQSSVLSKAVDKEGKQVKFFETAPGTVNLVVVCISDILLGAADPVDCLLATLGDSAVEPAARAGIFGLFQSPEAGHPAEILEIAKRFEHLRATLHGIIFLFKAPGATPLNYELRQTVVWNRKLASQDLAKAFLDKTAKALPVFKA